MSTLFLYGILRLFGIRVTSFYRDPAHNEEVGGVRTSKHIYLQAIDVGLDTPLWILKMTESMGFKLLEEKDHTHIENTPASEIFFSGPYGRDFYSLQAEIASLIQNNLKEVTV